MTPRSLFVTVAEGSIGDAAGLAAEHQFEAVPIVANGSIKSFWSQSAARIKPITTRHRVQHDDCVDWVLPRLVDHLVQFVYYRDEVVGLIDRSDLNRPLARLVVLQPLLECEQAIFLAVRARDIPEEAVAAALGPNVAADARRRQRRARREDLNVPLLEFVGFRDTIRAAVALGLFQLEPAEVARFASVRNRSAHGLLKLIEGGGDAGEILWALKMCARIRHALRKARIY